MKFRSPSTDDGFRMGKIVVSKAVTDRFLSMIVLVKSYFMVELLPSKSMTSLFSATSTAWRSVPHGNCIVEPHPSVLLPLAFDTTTFLQLIGSRRNVRKVNAIFKQFGNLHQLVLSVP